MDEELRLRGGETWLVSESHSNQVKRNLCPLCLSLMSFLCFQYVFSEILVLSMRVGGRGGVGIGDS